MKRGPLALLASMLVAWNASAAAPTVTRETFADLGEVAVIAPPAGGAPRDLLLVLDTFVKTPETESPALIALANQGHLVAHIALPQFLQRAAGNSCLNAVTLLDVFSQHLQERFRFAHYQRPVLIGIDSAAPFALATLAQAPNRLFQRGIGIRFQTKLDLPAPLCPAPGLTTHAIGSRQHGYQRVRLEPITPVTPWQTVADMAALSGAVSIVPSSALAPAASGSATVAATTIDDLPLVELPAATGAADAPANALVVLLSGDGGWANIDKDIGEALSRAGLPVVGWNSLQYFWRKKSPEQAGADLARVITHYQQTWRRPKVLLIGFSLGADVLPFMINRLPTPMRQSIADSVFLSLGHDVDFEFHVSDWLGSSTRTARPIAPELAKLKGAPLLCIYGRDDDDSLCAQHPAGVDVAQLPGDHHFDGDYQAAVRLILGHHAKLRAQSPVSH